MVSKKLNETELENRPTAQKSPILDDASVALLDAFHKKATKWDASAIEVRSKELARFAFDKVWVKP